MFVEYSLRVPKRCLFLRLKNYFCGRLLSLRLMICLQPERERERQEEKRGKERNACNSTRLCILLHDTNFGHLSSLTVMICSRFLQGVCYKPGIYCFVICIFISKVYGICGIQVLYKRQTYLAYSRRMFQSTDPWCTINQFFWKRLAFLFMRR